MSQNKTEIKIRMLYYLQGNHKRTTALGFTWQIISLHLSIHRSNDHTTNVASPHHCHVNKDHRHNKLSHQQQQWWFTLYKSMLQLNCIAIIIYNVFEKLNPDASCDKNC